MLQNIDLESFESFTTAVGDLVGTFNKVADSNDSIAEKTILIKQVIDCLSSLAIQAINKSRTNIDFLGQAIGRTQTIMDVLGDDDYEGAPFLVQNGTLDRCYGDGVTHIWRPVAEYKNNKLHDLRRSLTTMLERESVIVTAQRQIERPQRRLKR